MYKSSNIMSNASNFMLKSSNGHFLPITQIYQFLWNQVSFYVEFVMVLAFLIEVRIFAIKKTENHVKRQWAQC